jgi:hypothetical protein
VLDPSLSASHSDQQRMARTLRITRTTDARYRLLFSAVPGTHQGALDVDHVVNAQCDEAGNCPAGGVREAPKAIYDRPVRQR